MKTIILTRFDASSSELKTNLKPVYFVAKIDKNYVKNAKIVKKLR